MVKQFRILAIVFSLGIMPVSIVAQASAKRNALENHPVLKKFCASYIASMLLGGGIGIATGSLLTYAEDALVNYVEKHQKIDNAFTHLLILALGWMLESEIRNDVVAGTQGDLDSYQIPYKKVLMFRSACIASWITYLRNTSMLA